MPTDIRHVTVAIAAGTLPATPVTVNLAMPPRVVSRIDWKVPTGPMGTMGFLLAMSGVPVLPVYGKFTWVSVDGKDGTWPLDSYPDSGAWQMIGYNTGAYSHSVVLTFYCDLPVKPAPLRSNLSPYDLMPSPDLSKAGPPVKGR